MPDSRFEADTPFTESDILEIEKALGRELPQDYSKFVKEYGGAFVGGLVDGSAELPILTFFKSSGENNLLSKLKFYSDLMSDSALPIADCEFGNLYVLDKKNKVYYIKNYGAKAEAKFIASTFKDFINRIVVIDE